MVRILLLGIVVALVAAVGISLVRRYERPNGGSLELVGGRHFVPPELDSEAPGAAAIRRELGRSSLGRAERAARRAVRENPDSPGAHYNLGGLLLLRGRVPDAVREYRQAIAIDPAYARARDALTVAEEVTSQH